jgi:threonine dehydrogenase-like Zn-dependent dehydrogenase
MKAITLHGVGDVRVESVADPRIVDPTDVVVRITTSAICGSDLHQYHGRGAVPGAPPLVEPGSVMVTSSWAWWRRWGRPSPA